LRIREIDLVGFKSFREPTKLRFGPGMNAIVGPNGCGKSNVSDAIRWALGEQSVKNLRARDMEDIIFCGNDGSAPLNFAEVTLTFEQSEDAVASLLPEEGVAAQVARLPEFSVTRRLFRSGESQYLLNQSPARLRDITELFLGTGLGPKAYAMIEQGRVMQLVGAKPEEIRLFIEEAAGTTRFRSRKIASERKLDRTNENLSRVTDVMREIERQLSALQRQAKRAEEFKKLEAELRDVEIYLAGCRFGVLAEEGSTCNAELMTLRTLIGEVETQLAELSAQRDEVQIRDRETKEAIEQMFAALADVASAVVRATERQTATRDSLQSLEERLERVTSEDAELASREEALSQGLASATADLEARESVLRAAEAAAQTAEDQVQLAAPAFQQAEDDCNRYRAELANARSLLAEVAERRAESAARVAGIRDEAARIADRLEGRQTELAAASTRAQAAGEREVAARTDHGRLEDTRKGAAETLRLREDELRRLEESQSTLRETLLHVGGRIDGLRELERSKEGYADGIDTILARADGPLGLLVESLEIPAALEPAVAAVLGDVLRGAVVEGPEDGARLAEALRSAGEGRISFVPRRGQHTPATSPVPPGCRRMVDMLSAKAGFSEVLEALFGRVLLTEDLATAVSAFRSSPGAGVWVTLSGDLIDERGVVTGGHAPEGVGLLERRRVLTELEEQQAREEAALEILQARILVAREDCVGKGEALRSLDAQAHDATLELVAAEHALEAARREHASADVRIAETEEELRTAEGSRAESEQRAQEAEQQALAAEAGERSAQTAMESSGEQLGQARSAFELAQSTRDGARHRLSESRQLVTEAVAEHARQQHAREVLQSRRRTLGEDTAQLAQERERAVAALAQLAEELSVARERHATEEAAVEEARGEAREVSNLLADCEKQVGEVRSDLDGRRERINQLDVRSASLEAQMNGVAEGVMERYEVVVADVFVPEDFEQEIAAERVVALKKRIERLGAVNVTAIADAQELEERYGFLQTQRADLEASIEDLRKTIGELSRTTRARFKETFEQAREKFSLIFKELFRGGSADLILTQPNNLLETGVEIVAQPPGKAVRSLAMLSGGERSLTAVSLIMALFSLRATPFCLLDEVDAPLDDANVGRFSALLKRMSADTQFLIITHKQRTMEQADSLYGVTMPEAGISQIVSVEVEEAARVATDGMAASA
jgi:chromosome segregation protein